MKNLDLLNILKYSLILILISSCDKEFHSVGGDLFSYQELKSNKLIAPVYTFQEKINSVQTDGLPIAQLGLINHPTFGITEASIVSQIEIATSPVFGKINQFFEDEGSEDDIAIIPENEKVTNVYLEIPFFTNQNDKDEDGLIDSKDSNPNDPQSNSDDDQLTDIVEFQAGLNPLSSDSDGDGILDHEDLDNSGYDSEDNLYEIDSLYGDINSSFNIKVHELTYYLNDLDASNNFETQKIYYSNQDFYDEGFFGKELSNTNVKLNLEELVFYYLNDDPLTEDVDERDKVELRLSPRIRIPLDNDFFQKKIIEMEGKSVLESSSLFKLDGIRGLIIQTENFSNDLYMLLNFNSAQIRIEYEFDSYNNNGTQNDSDDDEIERLTSSISFPFGGIRVNTIKNSFFNLEIDKRIKLSNEGKHTDRLFIKSGKYHGLIRLFSKNSLNENTYLNELRNKNIIINEANISFYIDDNFVGAHNLVAERLYLYDILSGQPLNDLFIDGSTDISVTNGDKKIFGGILEYDNSNKPYRYKFNITNHISNIIRKDSTNFDLGLVVNSNINDAFQKKALIRENEFLNYPRSSILNPLGAILVGSNLSEEENKDKKVQLEIIYTEY
tara:strand:+ start:643 stop:2478 length:1836 start_codon:yes stop_codon:yes gene_type:complete